MSIKTYIQQRYGDISFHASESVSETADLPPFALNWTRKHPLEFRQLSNHAHSPGGGEIKNLGVHEHPLSTKVHPLIAKNTLSKLKINFTKHLEIPSSQKIWSFKLTWPS